MKTVKVSNMKSVKNSNKTVANQFEIVTENGTYFQSYESIIAFKPNYNMFGDPDVPAKIVLDQVYWNYSATTRNYRNAFLGENTKETQAKIDNGTYVLEDLNGSLYGN